MDEAAFAEQVREVVGLYEQAPALAERGVRVVSCDEKTSIQALERLGRTDGPRKDRPERIDCWYRRHGTLTLIANLDVATGELVAANLGDTRTNDDFAAHIEATVATDPEKEWVFVVDNLNTHCSEHLVRWVAAHCGISAELGAARRGGILKSMRSRTKFLKDPSHRVRFVFTPKHCSWLNQIENWFGRLVRAALRRASFPSKEALRQRILDYISFYNRYEAEPIKWNSSASRILAKFRIGTSEGHH